MYAYIEGTIAFLEEDRVVLDAGGIGYEIMVGQRDLVAMDAVGSRARLYTYFQVSENGIVRFFAVRRQEVLREIDFR